MNKREIALMVMLKEQEIKNIEFFIDLFSKQNNQERVDYFLDKHLQETRELNQLKLQLKKA
jgi:hypothetical protein